MLLLLILDCGWACLRPVEGLCFMVLSCCVSLSLLFSLV